MPVDRNSHSGVCTVMAGSRIAARGITSSWRSISLILVRALVTPAMALNSPPAIVVGTLIWRTAGAFIGGVTPLWVRILFDILDRANVIGEAELHRSGAVGDRAAAYGNNEIGTGRFGLPGGGNDGLARGVRRHRIEGCHATRAKRFSDSFDLAGLPVERAAHHA